MACVYCLRVGSLNRFKIGRTKGSAERRRKSVSVGSPDKLSIWREITTEHAPALETYLHHFLALNRTPNGEFFDVSEKDLETAIATAISAVSELKPIVNAAQRLRRKRPSGELAPASPATLEMRDELRQAKREMFLLEQRIQLLEGKLQLEIGENTGIAGIAIWKWREKWDLDAKRLRRELPDIYEHYKRDASSRIFRLE